MYCTLHSAGFAMCMWPLRCLYVTVPVCVHYCVFAMYVRRIVRTSHFVYVEAFVRHSVYVAVRVRCSVWVLDSAVLSCHLHAILFVPTLYGSSNPMISCMLNYTHTMKWIANHHMTNFKIFMFCCWLWLLLDDFPDYPSHRLLIWVVCYLLFAECCLLFVVFSWLSVYDVWHSSCVLGPFFFYYGTVKHLYHPIYISFFGSKTQPWFHSVVGYHSRFWFLRPGFESRWNLFFSPTEKHGFQSIFVF